MATPRTGAYVQGGLVLQVVSYDQFIKDITNANKAIQDLGKTSKDTADTINATTKDYTALGLALAGVGAAGQALFLQMGFTASRIEELDILLEVTRRNAIMAAEAEGDLARASALTYEAVHEQERGIRDLHLSGEIANKTVATLIRYNLDWTRATDLARLAQDSATYAMEDSSVAVDGLIRGITTLQPRVLRNYGLMINLDIAYKKWADEAGRTVKSMTVMERQQAALNEVLAQAPMIAGAYEAAMGTASKQVRSIQTDLVNLSEAFGEEFTGALTLGVGAIRDVMNWLTNLSDPMQSFLVSSGLTATVLSTITGAAIVLIPKLRAMNTAFTTLATSVGLSNIALGGFMAAVPIVVGAVAALRANAKAHHDEAIAIFDASSSYYGYIVALRDAQLGQYELSEAIYETIKAKQHQDAAFSSDAAVDATATLKQYMETQFLWAQGAAAAADTQTTAFDEFMGTMEAAIRTSNDLYLALLKDTDGMIQFFQSLGLSSSEAAKYAYALKDAAEQQENLNEFLVAADTATNDHVAAMLEAKTAVRDWADELRYQKDTMGEAGQELLEFAKKVNLTVDEVLAMRNGLGYTDKEIEAFVEDLNLTGGEIDDLANKFDVSRNTIKALNRELGLGEDAINDIGKAAEDYAKELGIGTEVVLEFAIANGLAADDLDDLTEELKDAKQAAEDANDEFKDFNDTLNDLISDWNDLGDDADESAADYDQAVADLNKKTGQKLAKLGEKFEGALPKKTTVKERMGMVEDAWDEFALRAADVAKLGAESPSWGKLVEQLAGTEYAFETSQRSAEEWGDWIYDAFYQGKITDAINTNAALWKKWTQDQAADFKKAQGEIYSEAATSRKKLDDNRAAELADQERAQDLSFLSLSLHLAQSSGALEDWATERFPPGPLQNIASDADKLFEGIVNGTITVDSSLQQVLADAGAMALYVLQSTQAAAEGNEDAWSNLREVSTTEAAEIQTKVGEIETKMANLNSAIANLTSLKESLPPEQAEDIAGSIEKLEGELAKLEDERLKTDPAAVWAKSFEDASREIGQQLDDVNNGLLQLGKTMTDDVVPEVQDGTGDIGTTWDTTVNAMKKEWLEMYGRVIRSIQEIIDKLDEIPRQIDVVIKVTQEGGIGDDDGATAPPGESPPDVNDQSVDFWFPILDYSRWDSLLAKIREGAKDAQEFLEDLLDVGSTLAGIGKFYADWYEEIWIEPLDDAIDEVMDSIDDLDDQIGDIDDRINELKGIEPEELDIFPAVVTPEDYLILQGMTEEEQKLYLLEQKRAQLEEERLKKEEERAKLEEERLRHEEKLLALQEAQQQLENLEQQAKLLELIRDYGLDPGEILRGIKLGLDVGVEDLVEAMTRAIQAIIDAANQELQIGSPSKVFVDMFKTAMTSAEKGIEQWSYLPASAMSDAMKNIAMPVYGIPDAVRMIPPQLASSSRSVAINMGGVTITNDMDAAMFEARVERSVTRALRNGAM